MIIKEINIENFRSIKQINLKIRENYLQLIGENNSGKTNVFQAINLFFKNSISGIGKTDFFNEDLKSDIKISIIFKNLNSKEIQFFQDFLIDNTLTIIRTISINEDTEKIISSFSIKHKCLRIPLFAGIDTKNWKENKDKIAKIVEDNGYQDIFFNERGILTKESLENGSKKFITEKENECEKDFVDEKNPFKWDEVLDNLPEVLYIEATKKISEETNISTKSQSIYKKIIEKILIKNIKDMHLLEKFEVELKNLNNVLIKTKEDSDNRYDIIKEVEKEISNNLNKSIFTKTVEIKFHTPKSHDFFGSSDIFIDDGINSSIEEKGDGLKRSLIFALFLAYSKLLSKKIEENQEINYRPFIFLIEEPELYLHPQAQKKLADVLYSISEFDQVFYSTHCPYFINIKKYLSIILVQKKNIEQGTTICFIKKKLFEPETKDDFNLLLRFNSQRNEMFFAKKIIFVEGDAEKIVISGISEKLDKDFNDLNISVITCEGKFNLNYFIKISSFFDKPIIIIHDIDPLTLDEQLPIDKLKEKGYSEKKIEYIKQKRVVFNLNQSIREEIEKSIFYFGLITINPNFENLIGITETQPSKPYKAYNYIKRLSKESISKELISIIDFIMNFEINTGRTKLDELKICTIIAEKESIKKKESNIKSKKKTFQESLF